jgi:hypothetical protein
MEVWVAKEHSCGPGEELGIFSSPDKAKAVCWELASEYFGKANTRPLEWNGNDASSFAVRYGPPTGSTTYYIKRFTIDEAIV